MSNYVPIANIVSPFGIKGHLIAQPLLSEKTKWKLLNIVFIEKNKNSLIPFFIKELKKKHDGSLSILFEDILTKESAQLLARKKIYVTYEVFEQIKVKNELLGILGFQLYNNKDFVGEVLEIINQEHQILLTILYKSKQAYVPLHKDNLINIDYKSKKIVLEIPEGLLDIYT